MDTRPSHPPEVYELAQRCSRLEREQRCLLFEVSSLQAKLRVLRESRGVDVASLQAAFDTSSATELKELRGEKEDLQRKLEKANAMAESLLKERRSKRLGLSGGAAKILGVGQSQSSERKGADEQEGGSEGGRRSVAAVLVRRLRPRQIKEVIYRAWGSEGLVTATAEKLSRRALQERCIHAAEAIIKRGDSEEETGGGEGAEKGVKDIAGWLVKDVSV